MTTENKGSLGDIKVEMGDDNNVGHIGHKIVFQSPPPPPNAIHQDGRVVGTFDGQPKPIENGYVFSKLFIDGPFNRETTFTIQGVKLRIEKIDAEAGLSNAGRPRIATLWNAVCRFA